ncbi:efflux RND transporter permease subunit [Marinobacter xestospongiae]|uniref:efflux RND transporter permease subunit n=1 Tax=Marinobacter xestospongiae TaxID=994319 RepID=UPI0020066B52|nr:efflux RND transporter permease subunit [Marinobacter xestospongiae]MCK7566063.1 efflux RND transporter permease subunit [Marinobacter xestospongiae]
MNLTEAAFRFRPVVLLSVLALMLYGALSFFSLPAREDPKITIREAIVSTSLPGLRADRVEALITRPLEEAILGVSGVEELRSVSSDGQSIIYAKAYDRLNELDQVWDEVEEAVTEATPALPEGTHPPRVNDSFGDVGIITLALTGSDYSLAELHDFAEHSREVIRTLAGTRKVEIIGTVEQRIFIEVSGARLAELGIPPDAIAAALQSRNSLQHGALLDSGDRAFSLVPSGEFQTITDIEQVLIAVPDESPKDTTEANAVIRLGEIANITRGYADPAPRRAYFNGKPAVVLSIIMQPDQSVLDYSERAQVLLDDLAATLPVGLDLDVITWQADQVENAVYGVSSSVVQTLAIVLAFVVLFLGVRTGLIVGAIIPAVMLITLAMMAFLGMSLERMSLATLVIALGLLVDNGVVVAEHFKRLLMEGRNRQQALTLTGRELALPLLSSSLTTILVFLPLMMAEHASGEYTRNISLVILISLLSSWVLALTVTPTLCYLFIKVPAKTATPAPGLFNRVEMAYAGVLTRILRHRLAFVLAMFALLPLGAYLVKTTPAKFFPDSDRAQILVYVNLPAGVTTRTTNDRLQAMMRLIADNERYPELEDFAAYAGFGGPRFVLSLAPLEPAANAGFIVINARNRDAAAAAIPRLRDDFRHGFADVEARISGMFLGPSDPNVIQIQVKGPDADYIVAQSQVIEDMLTSIPGTIDVWSNWYNPVTRVNVEVDQHLAQRAGVTSEDIGNALTSYVSGRTMAQFREGDEVFAIVARAIAGERQDPGRLKTAPVFPQGSADAVPLAQIASINTQPGFGFIHREDLVRTVTVEARNLTLSPEDMAPILQPKLDALNQHLAPGHVVEFDGIVKDSQVGRAALFAGFPLCLGLSVLLLVAQFNGYRRPLIVVLTIPLVIIGVGMGLRIMQAQFGFMVILGMLALAGIIVNNAIMLIDRIDIERRQSRRPDSDIVISASVRRLRPILMTTITTIVGLLPLILGKDVLFYGMASSMAFGLAVGTILTLGVAPALYCLFFGIRIPGHADREPS